MQSNALTTAGPTGHLPLTEHYGQSLTRQDRSKHRAWIGVRVEAMLDPYWNNRPSDVVKAEMMREWMDGLDGFTETEIRTACDAWNQDPDNGKPRVGHIIRAIRRERVRLERRASPAPPELPKERITAERAAEICADAGFTPKRFDGGTTLSKSTSHLKEGE